MATEFGNKITRRSLLKLAAASVVGVAAAELLPQRTAEAQQAPLAEPLTPFSDLVESLEAAKARNMYTPWSSVVIDSKGQVNAVLALVSKSSQPLEQGIRTVNLSVLNGNRLEPFTAVPQPPLEYISSVDLVDPKHFVAFGGNGTTGGEAVGNDPKLAVSNDGGRSYKVVQIEKVDRNDVLRSPIQIRSKLDSRYSLVHFYSRSSSSVGLVDIVTDPLTSELNPQYTRLQLGGLFTSIVPSKLNTSDTARTFYSLKPKDDFINTEYGIFAHTLNLSNREVTTTLLDSRFNADKTIEDIYVDPTKRSQETLLIAQINYYYLMDPKKPAEFKQIFAGDLFPSLGSFTDVDYARFTRSGDILLKGTYNSKTNEVYEYIARVKANSNPNQDPSAVELLYSAPQALILKMRQIVEGQNGGFITFSSIYGPAVFSLAEKKLYLVSQGLTNQAPKASFTNYAPTAWK